MANYLLVFHGGGMPETPEEGAQVMKAWADWFASLDGAVVDQGNPASQTRRIAVDGTVSDDPGGPTGYSIIKADSLDAAVGLAKGCPVLAAGATIQVGSYAGRAGPAQRTAISRAGCGSSRCSRRACRWSA